MQFQTDDIVLAAYLKVIGARLAKIDSKHGRGTFHYENVAQPILDDFYLGKAKVEPTIFNNELKRLVTAVRSQGKK